MNWTIEKSMLKTNDLSYLPGITFCEFIDSYRVKYPALYSLLDPSRLSGRNLEKFIFELNLIDGHFESKDSGGRGDAYRRGQNLHPLARVRGIRRLFELINSNGSSFSPNHLILDVLGGNGALTRAIKQVGLLNGTPTIITSDVSPSMIVDAISQSIPAIREPAQALLFKDRSLDGIIFAYGTHHILPEKRLQAIKEAWRVLKPGCRVIIQDFEEGSLTCRWYSEVLDKYTVTGHKCKHFTRDGLKVLAEEAGFKGIEILDVYDPFVILGRTPGEAVRNLLEHFCSLFGMEKLLVPVEQRTAQYWNEVEEIFFKYGTFLDDLPETCICDVTKPTVMPYKGQYLVEFPRIALVAVGTKAI